MPGRHSAIWSASIALAMAGDAAAAGAGQGAREDLTPPLAASGPSAAPGRPVASTRSIPRPPSRSASDLLVTFAENSATLTAHAEKTLQTIAVGLNRPALSGLSFEIAAYTDRKERAAAVLAQRRAEVVKSRLVVLGVDARRMVAVGYGADPSPDPAGPTGDAIRRVEVRRLN